MRQFGEFANGERPPRVAGEDAVEQLRQCPGVQAKSRVNASSRRASTHHAGRTRQHLDGVRLAERLLKSNGHLDLMIKLRQIRGHLVAPAAHRGNQLVEVYRFLLRIACNHPCSQARPRGPRPPGSPSLTRPPGAGRTWSRRSVAAALPEAVAAPTVGRYQPIGAS